MGSLPDLDRTVNRSPHVVILGAGASLASFPNGEAGGMRLPLMDNILQILDLEDLLRAKAINTEGAGFESIYDDLSTSGCQPELVAEIERHVYDYFSKMKLPDHPTIYD